MLFILIFVVFLLAGRNPYAEHSEIYKAMVHKIRRYLATKVVISVAVGVLAWASLSIIGLELAGHPDELETILGRQERSRN